MKAQLIEYFKQEVKGQYILEVKIWRVRDKRYSNGIKYSLIFLELLSERRILMDNHHPKKPHLHIDEQEFEYHYVNIQTLLDDFKHCVFKHFSEKI